MTMPHQHGGDVFAVARSLGVRPEKILDFSASINPLGMAPAVPGALADCVNRLLHYPDKGAPELKHSLAAYHGVCTDEIAVANGSTELIHLVPRTVKGSKGLIVAPAFAEYALALERAGWGVDYFTLKSDDGFRLPVSRLAEKIAEGYDVLFLCNPGNPTGVLIERDDIEKIVGLCRESGTFLVLDEAFIDFCEEASAKDLVRRSPGCLLLRSMTKFFAIPGLRLGYAIGAPETIKEIASLQDPWSVNTAAQVAGIASLKDPDYCKWTRGYIEQERARLAASLEKLDRFRIFPGKANYLLGEMVAGGTASELRAGLMKKGILIRDCGNFEGLDHRFFRVAVRLRQENETLLRELRMLLLNEPRTNTCYYAP